MASSRTLLDDDRFRIVEWTIEPGDAIEMHTHPYDYAVLPSERATMWAVLPDGTELEVRLTPGEAYTRAAGAAHRMENRGTATVVFTEVESKAAPAA